MVITHFFFNYNKPGRKVTQVQYMSMQYWLMHDSTLVAHVYQLFVQRKTDMANCKVNTPDVMYITS